MSLIGSFLRKSKLNEAIGHVSKARKKEGAEADHHFESAYKGFFDVIGNDLLFSETLYNWGFALLHQAKTKVGDEAVGLYEKAIEKFSFCRMVNPDSLGAAIDGGVVYMDLARLKGAGPNDPLYDLALEAFQTANRIQTGSASYNLACIYALRNDQEACLNALEDSRDRGSLPLVDDILGDSDLDGVKSHHWFVDFIESLNVPAEPEPAPATEENAAESSEQAETGAQSVAEPVNEAAAEVPQPVEESAAAVQSEASPEEPETAAPTEEPVAAAQPEIAAETETESAPVQESSDTETSDAQDEKK